MQQGLREVVVGVVGLEAVGEDHVGPDPQQPIDDAVAVGGVVGHVAGEGPTVRLDLGKAQEGHVPLQPQPGEPLAAKALVVETRVGVAAGGEQDCGAVPLDQAGDHQLMAGGMGQHHGDAGLVHR